MNSLKISGFNINSKKKIIISGSKSESNRVLILKYLFNPDIIIDNLSNSDDTKVLLKALENQTDIIDIHHAGTAMRFLTSLFAVTNKKNITLTGSDRMQQRPIGELVDSLQNLGADIIYEKEIGYPPLRFNGFNQTNKLIELRSDISSQFASSLMLVAPYLNDGLQIKLVGNIFSKPYILLTCEIMKKFGFSCIFNKDEIKIKSNKKVSTKNYSVESDWSSASYLYSIVALSGIELNLSSFKSNSLQGDSKLSKLYENFGVKTYFKNDEIIINGGIKSVEDIKNHSLPYDCKIPHDFLVREDFLPEEKKSSININMVVLLCFIGVILFLAFKRSKN